jgi:hypothetical protein
MPERDAAGPAEQGTRLQQAGADVAYLHASHDIFRLDLRPHPGAPLRLAPHRAGVVGGGRARAG